MELPIFDQNGKEVGSLKLPKALFGIDFNADLVHQVMRAQLANRRKPIAHTKDRGEVAGGGRKPWPQKGTGRARHGSIRSPIWRKGGVVFGPRKERVYKQKINKKMRRKALAMVLSAKLIDKEIFVIDDLNLEEPKTKILSNTFKRLGILGKTFILSLPKIDREKINKIILAARNIKNLKLLPAADLNVLDLLSAKYLVLTKKGIEELEKIYIDKKSK